MAVNKKKIQKKAAEKAAQKYAAEKRRQRQMAANAKDTYKEGIGAARGLKHLVVDAKKAQLAGLDETGISGLAKQQLIDQLKQGIDSAGNIVPVEKASLKPELQDTLADINDNLFSLGQSEENAAESYYNSILSRKRTLAKKRGQRERAKTQRVRESKAEARANDADFNKEVNAAMAEIRDAIYSAAIKDAPAGEAPDRKAALREEAERLSENPDRFKAFIDHLAGSAGSRKAAVVAARKYLRRYYDDPSIFEDAVSGF